MVIVIGLVITFRAHIPGVESIPNVPIDYIPSYTTDQSEDPEHPSHVENVHDIIDNLEFHKIDLPSTNDQASDIKTNTDNNNENLECGDIEATKRIFNNLQVIDDKSKIHIWPLPQTYTIFTEIVSINVNTFQYESNVDHRVITKGIERYKSIMFPHRTQHKYQDDSATINKVECKDIFYLFYIFLNILHSFKQLIIYVLDNGIDDKLDFGFDEEYELIIHDPTHEHSCNEIILRSNKIYGALRGLETLSQLITYNFIKDEYEINVGIIKDHPRYKHRGVLLDTSRHFHPVPAVKRFLLSLSFAKFNVFHWHIVDEESFPYQSNAFPKLQDGAYSNYERYSEYDIFDIIHYAQDLGIRVVPEFDTPGHAGSWCKGYRELCIKAGCRDYNPNLLDPSKEFTWTLIDGLFKEAATERFNDSFFHLGMF